MKQLPIDNDPDMQVDRIPAEACTDIGANPEPPIGQPPLAYLLAPFIDRWPRFSALLGLIAVTALVLLVGEPDPASTLGTLPTDGIPTELREEPMPWCGHLPAHRIDEAEACK